MKKKQKIKFLVFSLSGFFIILSLSFFASPIQTFAASCDPATASSLNLQASCQAYGANWSEANQSCTCPTSSSSQCSQSNNTGPNGQDLTDCATGGLTCNAQNQCQLPEGSTQNNGTAGTQTTAAPGSTCALLSQCPANQSCYQASGANGPTCQPGTQSLPCTLMAINPL